MDAGDVVLADHFKTAPQNAQHHSPRIQNGLILCTGEWIRNKEVQHAKFFSVCADEAADCSNKEQLPLVLRFVSPYINPGYAQRYSDTHSLKFIDVLLACH